MNTHVKVRSKLGKLSIRKIPLTISPNVPNTAPNSDCFRCASLLANGSNQGGMKQRLGGLSHGEEFQKCRSPPPLPPARLNSRMAASTSIDLIDLVEDRYSNFNPGYKSTTPPDDEFVSYPMSKACSTFSNAPVPVSSLPVLNEAH